jgi:hypothetical protein
MTASGGDIRIETSTSKVVLPVMRPGDRYTIKTGQPVTIEPAFQEVKITITKAIHEPDQGETP